jgi:hypothetical protein
MNFTFQKKNTNMESVAELDQNSRGGRNGGKKKMMGVFFFWLQNDES